MKVSQKACSACGGKFSCAYDGVPYCNKHYLRMHNNGTLEPKPRKRTTSIARCEDHAKIITSKGQEILIDAADVDYLNRYSWCISKTGYAVANVGGKVTKLHRYLLSPGGDEVVDHINGNPLDNRRCNLRTTTPKNNSRNVAASRGSKTGFVGISMTQNGRYRARIMCDGKEIRAGNYKTLEEAIDARQRVEREYFGQYAPSESRQ